MIRAGVLLTDLELHEFHKLNAAGAEDAEPRSDMLDVLASWLKDGAPVVSPELAEQRGEICSKCPLNTQSAWWEKISKDPIADTIREWIQIKDKMQIGVKAEQDLGMCRACGCCIRLKIWEPLHYILEHTSPEMMDKYIPECWVKTEQ